jgi:hypothetical protein
VSTYASLENRNLQPACIVQPASTQDVSRAIVALSSISAAGDWNIAIKSGGHGYAGSNAVARGVNIDLAFLNSTELVEGESQEYPATRQWNGTSMITQVGSLYAFIPKTTLDSDCS